MTIQPPEDSLPTQDDLTRWSVMGDQATEGLILAIEQQNEDTIAISVTVWANLTALLASAGWTAEELITEVNACLPTEDTIGACAGNA